MEVLGIYFGLKVP